MSTRWKNRTPEPSARQPHSSGRVKQAPPPVRVEPAYVVSDHRGRTLAILMDSDPQASATREIADGIRDRWSTDGR